MAKKAGRSPNTRQSRKNNNSERAAPVAAKEIAEKNERPVKQPASKPLPSAADGSLSVVGIGASAGGLEAFEQLLSALPNDTGLAFVLVQHLAPSHDSILSELLSKATDMSVVEVSHGMRVQANHIYVIPPNAEMSIA